MCLMEIAGYKAIKNENKKTQPETIFWFNLIFIMQILLQNLYSNKAIIFVLIWGSALYENIINLYDSQTIVLKIRLEDEFL